MTTYKLKILHVLKSIAASLVKGRDCQVGPVTVKKLKLKCKVSAWENPLIGSNPYRLSSLKSVELHKRYHDWVIACQHHNPILLGFTQDITRRFNSPACWIALGKHRMLILLLMPNKIMIAAIIASLYQSGKIKNTIPLPRYINQMNLPGPPLFPSFSMLFPKFQHLLAPAMPKPSFLKSIKQAVLKQALQYSSKTLFHLSINRY